MKPSLTTGNTRYDLIALLCGMTIAAPLMFSVVVGEAHYRLSVGMMVFIAVLLPAILINRNPVKGDSALIALFLTFSLWGLFVIAISIPSDNSFRGFFSFFYQMFLFSHVFVGNRLLRSYDSILNFTGGIVLMLALTGIFVLLLLDPFQSLVPQELKVHYMSLEDSDVSGQLLHGIQGWPNGFATFLAAGIIFAFNLSVSSKTLWQKTVFAIVTLELIMLIILTFSRTGWITLFIAVFSTIVISGYPRQVVKPMFLVFAVILLLYYLSGYPGQVLKSNLLYFDSFFARLTFYKKVLAMIDPSAYVIGNGFMSVDVLFVGYGDPLVDVVRTAHNDYLSIFLRAGLPGLMLYIGMLSICFWSTFRGTKIDSIPDMQRFMCLWAGISIAFFASGFTQESMRFWPISGTFFLISGGIMGMLGEDNKRKHHNQLQYLEIRS